MFSWHGKLLPPFSAQVHSNLKPLTGLLKGGAKTLEWTVSAFQNAKRLLAAVVPLQHPAPNAELSLATDALDTHIGGVMQQKSGDHWQPLGFSHVNSQTRNHVIPLLIVNYWLPMQPSNISAIFAKVKHFNLDRSQTTCHCHFSCFSPYFTQMLYLPSLKNVVADFLSRPNQATTGSVAAASPPDPVDFEEMAAEQNCCPKMQRLLGGTSLKLAFRQTGAQRLAGDVSTGNFRPIVPLKFRNF